ncbi:MAG: response regulator [Desulfobulbaceae bacterium]|nr:response regulator [Desulfobulbaceae bacterium]
MERVLKFLLVEDNPGDADLIIELLSETKLKKSIIQQAGDLKSALAMLNKDTFDIILLDLGLPDSSGLTGLRKIIEINSGIPIVVVSGQDDLTMSKEAIQQGAEDYLIKGRIDDEILSRVVLYSIERNKQKRELQAVYQQLLASEQQLRESNQQLTDSVQQLQASNQQLAASEQQLRVNNHKLVASERELILAKERAEKSERELQFKNEEYEVINEELRLTNNELILAKEKAEESDRLKSAFLANMSHEIRTPMNGILGFTNLILEPDLSSEEKEEFINLVQKSGQRMLNTVNDIIEISKIEAGLVNLIEKKTDINDRVEDLTNFFRIEAEKKGLNLIFDKLFNSEIIILTDQNKFDSILSNLIKNAIKYTDTGTINVGCRQKGIEIEFYVKDTGIGIPTHRQKAVFNRFEQADIADKRVFEGSGLGLAIATSYVEMLGGKIWLESEEGIGSTFYFTLPYKAELKKEANVQQLTILDKTDFVRKLKVLIAEDDYVSEIFLSKTIKKYCKEILNARTGFEAIELCRQNKDVDLVLMDIKMPGMDGYEATRKIREYNKDVVIIAQTAYGLSGDREKAIQAGCNDYISKPIKLPELIEIINKHLSKSHLNIH